MKTKEKLIKGYKDTVNPEDTKFDVWCKAVGWTSKSLIEVAGKL